MALELVSQALPLSRWTVRVRRQNTIIARVIFLGELDRPDSIGCIWAHDRLLRVWFVYSSRNLMALYAWSSIHNERTWNAATIALLAL